MVDITHKVFHPRIDANRLPEAERDYCHLLNNLINNLDYHTRAFGAALSLFEYATAESEKERNEELKKYPPALPHDRQSAVFDSWRTVAGRDGAMTLFHFQKTFEAIRVALKGSPTINALTDQGLLDEGCKAFKQQFPHATQIRHSVSHLAEFAGNLKGWQTHAFNGSYEGPPGGLSFKNRELIIVDLFQGNAFTTTFKKKIITYELSVESMDSLRRSGHTIWRAFHEPTIRLTLQPE